MGDTQRIVVGTRCARRSYRCYICATRNRYSVGCAPWPVEFVHRDPQKVTQWAAYAESISLEAVTLVQVVAAIWAFLGPSCERLNEER